MTVASGLSMYSDVESSAMNETVLRYTPLVKRIAHHLLARMPASVQVEDLIQAGEKAIEAIDAWEGNVVQTKMETFQDVVNFLNRLNAHMLDLLSTIDSSDPPLTQGQRIRFSDLSEEWQSYKKKLDDILNEEVQEYNQLYKQEGLPAVIIPEK